MNNPTPQPPSPPDRTFDRWIPEVGDRFLVASSTGYSPIRVCKARGRAKVGDKDVIVIYDEEGARNRLEDCLPLEDDRPLNESEMEVMLAYVEDAITAMDSRFLDDSLGQLSPKHKQQVWDLLTNEQKRALALIRQMHNKPQEEAA